MMTGDILVVAPHPDDETLGAGGTLLRAKARGAAIHWLVVTAATEARWGAAYVRTQAAQIEAVRNAYPFDSFHWWREPASGLAKADMGALVDRMRDLLASLKPKTVLLPHAGDAHDDHAATFAAVTAAAKPQRMRALGVERLWAMEILSETDAAPPLSARQFLPTVCVDIAPYLRRKLDILELYKSEIVPGTARTSEIVAAHARVCGASFGAAAAERFMLVREFLADGDA